MSGTGIYVAPAPVAKSGFRMPQDLLPVILLNFDNDATSFKRALLAYNPAVEFHTRNVGEWWAIWTVLLEAHEDQMKTLVLPAIASITATGDEVNAKLKNLINLIARITSNLLALRITAAGERGSIVARLRELSSQLESFIRAYTAFIRDRIMPLWADLPADKMKSVHAALLSSYVEYGQWALPWLAAPLNEAAYIEFVQLFPKCCPNLQFTMHRYWRPQWRSRVMTLLPSIYDAAVLSPTEKDDPNYFWCCCGYDKEDELSKSCSTGYCVPVGTGKPKEKAAPKAAEAPKAAPAPKAAVPVVVPPPATVAPGPVITTPSNIAAVDTKAKAAPAPAPVPVLAPAPAPIDTSKVDVAKVATTIPATTTAPAATTTAAAAPKVDTKVDAQVDTTAAPTVGATTTSTASTSTPKVAATVEPVKVETKVEAAPTEVKSVEPTKPEGKEVKEGKKKGK